MDSSPSSGRQTADTFASGILRTPPYTPNPVRRRFERSDSPASVRSIHPVETISPTKQTDKSPSQDEVKVEELEEGDARYPSDAELVYPEELEEPESGSHLDDSSSEDDDESEDEMAQHFERLGCADEQEADFERHRRAKHTRRRTDSRIFKRTHSQSLQSDLETSDPDGMADHDLNSSARRLRRRVQGPSDVQVVFDEMQRTPPPSRGHAVAGFGIRPHESNESESSVNDAMAVDDSD